MTGYNITEISNSEALELMAKTVLAFARTGNYRIYRVPSGDLIMNVTSNKWFYRSSVVGSVRNTGSLIDLVA